MKLQRISILIFVVMVTIFLILVSLFFSSVLMASYSDLEEKYIQADLDLAINKFNDELHTMAATASDWGPWDDTVEFVNGNNRDYLSSNLLLSTFENLNLNIMVFTNTKGEVVYSGSYDLQNKEMVPVPPFFSTRIDPADPLMNMSDVHQGVQGVLMLPENPLLVVSQPIVYSNNTGPAQGVVIMGRFLSEEEISRLRTLIRPSLIFKKIDDPSLQQNIVSLISKNTHQPSGIIHAENQDQIAGYALINDIYGNNSLVLQITESRDIYHQGLSTTKQVIYIILAGSLFLGLGLIILQTRLVLRRMDVIARQVDEISQSGDPVNRVEIHGDDELSGLVRHINRMLETIEKTQKKLQEGEAQFRELVENLPDYIIVYGMNMEIRYMNPAAATVTGYEAETVIGMPVLSLVAEESRESAIAQIAARDESGMFPAYEIEIVTKEGLKRTVIVKSTRIQFNYNPATFLLLTDITARKELEKERELHAQELERYSSSLQKISRQLSLLSSITRHDILNKISIIYGYIGLAESEFTDPQLVEYLTVMKTSINGIHSQIEFTRLYEDIGSQEPQWIHLDAIMPRLYLPDSVTLTTDIQDIYIFADPMLEKVFFNLLDNSARHGQHVTEIMVSARESDDNLIIVWEDNGVGIPATEKEIIFERGFGKNTGLGMFLVREILSLTGICIKETGIPGTGARFEISVPKGTYRRKDHRNPDGA